VRMNLHYETEFGKDVSPDAYERLLLDVMAGDSTLFPSDTFVHKSWEFIQGILDAWKDDARVPMRDILRGVGDLTMPTGSSAPTVSNGSTLRATRLMRRMRD